MNEFRGRRYLVQTFAGKGVSVLFLCIITKRMQIKWIKITKNEKGYCGNKMIVL